VSGPRGKLGILAGGGPLPRKLIAACLAERRPLFVLAFHGETDPETVVGTDHAWVRLGAAGRAIQFLKQAACQDLVLAGPVRRLSPMSLRPDWRGLQFFARVGHRAWGDDGLLSAVIGELEAEGFRVIGAETVLPSLLAPIGVWGRIAPNDEARADVERGLAILTEIGRLDIGQAIIVQQGVVLGVEAVEGTDRLMERCRILQREGQGGVLVKARKPGQESRVDLPTIGPRTVALAKESGLIGIAVEAEGTFVLDQESVIARADSLGLFVEGVAVKR
jgi:DUF1009 family protein